MPLERREDRIRSVTDLIATYQKRYEIDHHGREQSILFSKGRLAHVTRLLVKLTLRDLTEDTIRGYIATRIAEGVSGRTINAEIGELSRAIGKPWFVLWPTVRKQEEKKDVGQALSPEQERSLLDAAAGKVRCWIAAVIIRIALLTAIRSGEITRLTWRQVDLSKRVITVGRAKTASGTGRQIPMNDDLFAVLSAHAGWFTKKFGETKPEHYLFPFGKPAPTDPTRPTTTLKTAWSSIRADAGVECRLHDLRHTALTKMAEAGVPESTMLGLAGHMSRAMLERYSHIRMAAKREAVQSLQLTRASTAPVKESVKAASGLPIQ
jgi:integrase